MPIPGCPRLCRHSRSAGDSSRSALGTAGSRSPRRDMPSGRRDTAPGAAPLRGHAVSPRPLRGHSEGTPRGHPLPGAGGWRFQAGKAVLRGTSVSPVGDTQRPWVRSQTVAWGQQCILSAQHEACGCQPHSSQRWPRQVPPQCPRVPTPHTWGMGQHPQAPLLVTQHVASLGHSDWPSGQVTARGAAETGEGSPCPSCPLEAHPCPPATQPCPRTQVCDTGLPISAAVGPSGTAVVAPGAGDTLGREKGVGGQGGQGVPPKWQGEGGN